MPAQPPAIVQVPSTVNMYPDRHGLAPEAVVLHIAEGTLAGCDSWFRNPDAEAGAHFCIGKNGEIHQYYKLSEAPWANGIIENGYTAKLIDANGQKNPNYWTVSIEHEGHSGDAVPDAQRNASIQLTAWLFDSLLFTSGATGVKVDRDHILRHGDISPLSRPKCPGWPEQYIYSYIQDVQILIEKGKVSALPPLDPMELINGLTMSAQSLRLIQAQSDATTTKARMAADGIDNLIKKYKG